MENKASSRYEELLFRISEMKIEKSVQEIKLKKIAKDFSHSLNPLSMVKNSIHHLACDKEVKMDLAKVGLNMGANFLIDKILGKNRSIKGFLSSMLIEKVSGSLISNNMPKILAGIGNFINGKKD